MILSYTPPTITDYLVYFRARTSYSIICEENLLLIIRGNQERKRSKQCLGDRLVNVPFKFTASHEITRNLQTTMKRVSRFFILEKILRMFIITNLLKYTL